MRATVRVECRAMCFAYGREDPPGSSGLSGPGIKQLMVGRMLEDDISCAQDDYIEFAMDVLMNGIPGLSDMSEDQIADEFEARYILDAGMFDDTEEENSMVYALRMWALVKKVRVQAAVDAWVDSFRQVAPTVNVVKHRYRIKALLRSSGRWEDILDWEGGQGGDYVWHVITANSMKEAVKMADEEFGDAHEEHRAICLGETE